MASGQVTILEKRRKRRAAGATLGVALTLPRPPTHVLPPWRTMASPSTSGSARPSRSKRADIAIVEDERDLLSVYSTFFRKMGFETVWSFDNGEDLLEAISEGETSPELVIMDYRLPGRDGLETAKKVVELNPETKVVITTADDSVRSRATRMGFAYLQKPFTLSELLQAVNGP